MLGVYDPINIMHKLRYNIKLILNERHFQI